MIDQPLMDQEFRTELFEELVSAAIAFQQFCDVARLVLLEEVEEQLAKEVRRGRVSKNSAELFKTIIHRPNREP